MASASRAAPWCLLLAAACVLAFGGQVSPAAAAAAAGGGQKTVADGILLVVSLVIRFALTVLPGAACALVGYTLYARRSQMTPKAWGGVAMLAVGCLMLWAMRVSARAESPAAPAAGGLINPDMIRSGEAVITKDGRFIRLPDPTKEEGEQLEPGWQRSLAGAMTDAIRDGQEQVVLIFSRQGCPWCERQKPVLERLIQKRAKDILAHSEMGGGAEGTAFIGGGAAGATGLLFAPLRVFVLDANEFPYLAQQFRIEAFPTSMVFGPPGATPLVAQGYLDDDDFEKILKTAAVSTPPSPGRQGRRKRRGLFR